MLLTRQVTLGLGLTQTQPILISAKSLAHKVQQVRKVLQALMALLVLLEQTVRTVFLVKMELTVL
jgi:hypothetical protein